MWFTVGQAAQSMTASASLLPAAACARVHAVSFVALTFVRPGLLRVRCVRRNGLNDVPKVREVCLNFVEFEACFLAQDGHTVHACLLLLGQTFVKTAPTATVTTDALKYATATGVQVVGSTGKKGGREST
jgi:hypothetical protein